ncbi:MAG: right-handed parallel beta-helix repeat-containing protein [Verrucomicrobiota bacterium]
MIFRVFTISALVAASAAAEPIGPEEGAAGIEKALEAKAAEIHLTEGLFLLPETLVISNSVRLVGAGEKTILSGARMVGAWELIDEARGIWRSASPLEDGRPVRQLFDATNGRLPRSRMPNEGWFRGDRLSMIDFDVNRVATRDVANGWRENRPYVFAGLRFREENAEEIRQLPKESSGAILQTISAWTSAWQPVRTIDHESRDMQLFTPSRYPLAHWSYGVNEGGGTPFAIENTMAGIDRPGEWCWNPGDDTILLKFDSDPNESRILTPALEMVIKIDGAEDVEIRDLQVAHSRTVYGRYDQHRDWHGSIKAWDPTFPDEFPEGLTVPQSAPYTGDAIHISNSQKIRIVNCRVSGVGGYAIRLDSNSHECLIRNCVLTDLGSGGVNIYPDVRKAESDFPTRNIVEESTITHGGQLHPAGCAIRLAESSDNRIQNNSIAHFGYTGISIGWAWNPRPNHTTGNHISGNVISHVMETLSDGAGIYSLGSIPGTRIEGNHIHNIGRAETAIGAGNSGIFFDQYSKGAVVRNNRLEKISSWHPKDNREPHPIKHHKNLPTDHSFEGNTVDGEPYPPKAEQE